MNDAELLNWCRAEAEAHEYISFPEELLSTISAEQAQLVAGHFASNTLMLLPEKERTFFEWLKTEDAEVWNDLWGADELGIEPYVVAIGFLPQLLETNRGFPICDLLTCDNYYFTQLHLITEESKLMLESVKERFMSKQKLTPAQLLTLEISISPIDIWRFAYNYKISLEEAKNAVKTLVEDKVLIHLSKAEHLANFIE
jgi:hypothetical protein